MGATWRCVLVHEEPAAHKAFDAIRSNTILQLWRVVPGVLGVRGDFCTDEEYRETACQMSRVAGSALFYHYRVGTSCTLFERGRLTEERGWVPEHEVWGALGLGSFSGDPLADWFEGRGGECLSVGIPSLFETILELRREDFVSSQEQRRTSLLNKVEVVEQIIEVGQREQAIELLEGIRGSLEHWLAVSALHWVQTIIDETVAQLRHGSDTEP